MERNVTAEKKKRCRKAPKKSPKKSSAPALAKPAALTNAPLRAVKTAEKKKMTRPTKAQTYKLTPAERKEGWRLPSKRRLIPRKTVQTLPEGYLGDNRFAVLAKLTCSQRKEIDRTGTLRTPQERRVSEKTERAGHYSKKKSRQHKKRKTVKATVCMASTRPHSPAGSIGSEEGIRGLAIDPPVPQPRMVTRSMARTMPHPPPFQVLPDRMRRRAVMVPVLRVS